MITKRFQNRVAESRATLPVVATYACLMCLAGGLLTEGLWIQFGLLAVSSFLMMVLNNSNALIRIYSRMVSCSFLAIAVMTHFIFVDIKCGIVQTCFIAFYLFLFSAYQDKRAVGKVFYAFMMLGIASTQFVQILYFVPVMWILLFTNIMSGNLRTLLASIMGVVAPYWFLGVYSVYMQDTEYVPNLLASIIDFGSIGYWLEIPLLHIVTMGFVVLLSVVGMIHFRLNNYKDKIRTRMLFEIFSIMILCNMVMLVLLPQYYRCALATLIVSASPVIGHYIALSHTRISNYAFFVIIFAVLALTVCNLWIPF